VLDGGQFSSAEVVIRRPLPVRLSNGHDAGLVLIGLLMVLAFE
jgi:hypothetical protein